MEKPSLTLVFVFAFATAMLAQEGLPTNVEPGKCYAKCYIADQWKTETVMSKEAGKRKETIRAKFKTVTETVVSKEAGKTVRVVPSKYETRTEQVLVKEESKKTLCVKLLTLTTVWFGVW
jgi:OOP family OmpA-OmpF porin